MQQSVHTQISKLIGHVPGTSVTWPTFDHAKMLLETVTNDQRVYEEVLFFHRYAKSGTNQEQYEVQDIMYQAWEKGNKYWSQVNVEE